MQPSMQFFDESGALDTTRLMYEAVPLAKLVAAVVVVAAVPFLLQVVLVEALGFVPALAWLFSLVTQFVLAVGTGLVLMYVIARGLRLGEEN